MMALLDCLRRDIGCRRAPRRARRAAAERPGVLLHLIRTERIRAEAVEKLFYEGFGLPGVSGISSDVPMLRDGTDPAAAEAVVVRATSRLALYAA